MKWQPAYAYKVRQVLIITFSWVFIGVFVESCNAIHYDPDTGKHFLFFIFGDNAIEHMLITAIGPFMGGLLAGPFIVFYQRKKLIRKNYWQQILLQSLFYILFVFFCILIVLYTGALFDKKQSFIEKFYNDLYSLRLLRLLFIWYFIVIFTIFFIDVSEKYGSGTLRNLLLGKYHSPGREDRIFMFLDLRSSTTIAEQIGDDNYFRMIRYFYNLVNEVTINNYGEIYQYVGDEIVISWNKVTGLKNSNCLLCFNSITQAVKQKEDLFMNKFKVVPQFKAAIHSGEVITGEIGTIKKDIVYSGDVLNTTARIVALCNHYNQTLIVSSTIYNELIDTAGYEFIYLDSPVLRGKSMQLSLYGVKAINHPYL